MQRVYAIGKPPDEGLCAFRDLVNVVVLPSVGKLQPFKWGTPFLAIDLVLPKGDRSLASCLGGGDVDGYVNRDTRQIN